MRGTLYGELKHPAIAVVGVWDPILPQHRVLFKFLATEAQRKSLSSLVIVFDPPPGVHLYGKQNWPIYTDVKTRINFVQMFGVSAVLRLHFTKQDLNGGAAEFFEAVSSYVTLQELWLGAKQSLGRGDGGATPTIRKLSEERGIVLNLMSDVQLPTTDALRLLAVGRPREATKLVGMPPFRTRPRRAKVETVWQPGTYYALPYNSLTSKAVGSPMPIEINGDNRDLPCFNWPDRQIKYLAFVLGPGDQAAEAQEPRIAAAG
jgi:hypothetical protein